MISILYTISKTFRPGSFISDCNEYDQVSMTQVCNYSRRNSIVRRESNTNRQSLDPTSSRPKREDALVVGQEEKRPCPHWRVNRIISLEFLWLMHGLRWCYRF